MMISQSMYKVAFVLGGANTLHDDIFKASELANPDAFIATNHAGRDFDIDSVYHWVTLHTELMPGWIDERRASGRHELYQLWTSNVKTIPPEHDGLYNHVKSWDGSSGLLAVSVALHLGYERIILCGIPLDKKADHYDYPGPWMDAPRYRRAWVKHLDDMKGKVKSFNGWTSLILGEPTEAWLNE